MDVTLGSRSPEYRSDIFAASSAMIGSLSEGKSSHCKGVLTPHAQSPEDLDHGYLSVEGVEVKTIHLGEGEPFTVWEEGHWRGIGGCMRAHWRDHVSTCECLQSMHHARNPSGLSPPIFHTASNKNTKAG